MHGIESSTAVARRHAEAAQRPYRWRAAAAAVTLTALCTAVAVLTSPSPDPHHLSLAEMWGEDDGPDPDAPGGTRDAILEHQRAHWTVPGGMPGGPRQQDFYYRHVYTNTGYPGRAFAGAGLDSENAVAVQRLHLVSGEISRAEAEFAQIDRQRAGVKGEIASLEEQEKGLDMEAKSAHADLMRYTAEQQAILGEMTDAPKKPRTVKNATEVSAGDEAGAAEGNATEVSEMNNATEVSTEVSEVNNATEVSTPGEGEAAEQAAAEDEEAQEQTEAESSESRIKALEEKVDALEKEVHGGTAAAERARMVTVLTGARSRETSAAAKRAEELLKKEGADFPSAVKHSRPGKPAARAADALADSGKHAAGVKPGAHELKAAARHTSSFLNSFF
jgi:hypothetical protein